MKNKTKILIRIFILIGISLISGCTMFVTRYYTDITSKELINNQIHFSFSAGVHLIQQIQKEQNITREDAVDLLLKKTLSEQGLCPNGFEILRRGATRNYDAVIDAKCK